MVDRPKSLLIIINPYGGKGKAKEIFSKIASPIFRKAGINYDVIETERANHGFELMQTHPLKGFDGVVSVGGDGMFNELFNGLLRRAAAEEGLDVHDKEARLVR